MNDEQRVKDSRDQLNVVMSFFGRVDSKLSTVTAINTAMLAALSASFPPLGSMKWWMWISPAATAFMLALGYVQLYRGSFPTLVGGHSSLIYFREIARRTEANFVAEYRAAQDANSLASDVLGQVWRNSEILVLKYNALKCAFTLMALAVMPWVISLATFAIVKSNLRLLVISH